MKMDPRDALGRQFDALGYPSASYVEEFRSWHAEEGMVPDWTIELRDESMQFLLTESRVVKTVFIFSETAISDVIGVSAGVATLKDVIARFGNPTRFGEEQHLAILGAKGAWLRYDYPAEVVHLEFRPGDVGIHMLTLMAPEHAP